MTAEQKERYQRTLMDRGLLLPPKPPGRQVKGDPFRAVKTELFVAESESDFTDKGSKVGTKKTRRKKATSKRTGGTKKGKSGPKRKKSG
ncbi:MAG: hypothetical protein MI861_17570 [Pirellulales bacterium]|nr:hypothetical protein [Pirellulales bacterium]